MANAILRLPAVKVRTGLSRSTIYLKISRRQFPAQVPLGGRAVGWLESEIDEWVAQQVKISRRGISSAGSARGKSGRLAGIRNRGQASE